MSDDEPTVEDFDTMTIYCLECRQTTSGNGWGLAPETGAVVCRCGSILTKVIEPVGFEPTPLRLP